MSQSFNEELARVPMSPNLVATLTRAADYAREQTHGSVTLEHMLLALTQDNDAPLVLQASGVAVDRLTADIVTHLSTLEPAAADGDQLQLSLGQDLKRVLEAAAAAAQQGRRQVSGAIVLAAIVGEGKSTAAHILRAHGLTFEHAIKALQQSNRAQAPRPGAQQARRPEARPAPAAPQTAAPPPAPLHAPETTELTHEQPVAPSRPQPAPAPPPIAEKPAAPVPQPAVLPPAPSPVAQASASDDPSAVTSPPPLRTRTQPPPPPPAPVAMQSPVPGSPPSVRHSGF